MSKAKQRVRALAISAAVTCLALSSPVVAQPAQEGQRLGVPQRENSSHSDTNYRDRDDARERPGRDWQDDHPRFRRQFGRNDDDSRGFDPQGRDRNGWRDSEWRRHDFGRDDRTDNRRFDRSERDRDDWRGAREWRDNRGFDRDAGSRQQPPTMERAATMIGHGWLMRVCGSEGDRMATLAVGRLERLTQPTEGQRATLDALKDAAARATEIARAACPTERPITPPGRLAAAEKRLEALLQAVRTVRPAMDSFYASLSDEQKARLLIAQSRPWRRGGWLERRETDRRGERSAGSSSEFRREGRNLGNTGRDREEDRSRDHGREGPGQDREWQHMPGDDEDGDGWPNEWQGRM